MAGLGVPRVGDITSCGDPVTAGSPDVNIEGLPAARIQVDTAIGLPIIGPGAQTVRANGHKLSLLGDAYPGHGIGPHAAPVIAQTSTTVKVGTGFVGGGTAGAGDNDQGFTVPPAELVLTALTTTTPSYAVTPLASPCFAIGNWTPACSLTPIQLAYTITNLGASANSGFNCGVFEVPAPIPFTLFRDSEGTITDTLEVTNAYGEDMPKLIQEFRVDQHLASGETVEGIETIEEFYITPGSPRYYYIAVDIDNEVGELSETQIEGGVIATTHTAT